MKIQLGYGREKITCSVPDDASVFLPPEVAATPDPLGAVRAALESPLAPFRWEDCRQARSAVIAVNDKTRPVPNHLLLPPLLEKLEWLGLAPDKIQILIATGTHLPMTAQEFGLVLPAEILQRYPVASHDISQADQFISLGATSRQTPVYINKTFYEAGIKIVVGDIEPHHFAGFSGGVKPAVIGLGGAPSINHNHAMLSLPDAYIAKYDTNPLRQDIEEMGDRVGVDLALNAVLNSHKEIVSVFAGSPRPVMQAGIPVSRRVCQVPVKDKFDIVIASAGGFPKDINLYQSQKVLTHASMITRDGGTVILLTACTEGVGSRSYEAFMEGKHSVDDIFTAFKTMEFQVGPHKAFQFARELKRIHVILVSQIEPERVRRLLLTPASTLEEAYSLAQSYGTGSPRVAVMPYATNTIPSVE